MLEDHFYWVMLHGRWVDPQGWSVTREVFFGGLPRPLRDLVPLLVRRSLRRDLRGQGLGRHDLPEIQSLGAEDVEALAAHLAALRDQPALRAELGARGRARVLALSTQQRIAEQTVAVYTALAGPGAEAAPHG